MAALRLTRKTFVEATITVRNDTGKIDRRTVTDYDAFQAIARRAFINPLVATMNTTVLYGDTAKRLDLARIDDDFDVAWGYDDGRGTEWEERNWADGCRDQASAVRSTRWSPNYAMDVAHRNAGLPKTWYWFAFDGTDLIDDEGLRIKGLPVLSA